MPVTNATSFSGREARIAGSMVGSKAHGIDRNESDPFYRARSRIKENIQATTERQEPKADTLIWSEQSSFGD